MSRVSKCKVTHKATGVVTVLSVVNAPVCTTTVLEALAACQLPYGQYQVQHDSIGGAFGVTFTREDQELYFAKQREVT